MGSAPKGAKITFYTPIISSQEWLSATKCLCVTDFKWLLIGNCTWGHLCRVIPRNTILTTLCPCSTKCQDRASTDNDSEVPSKQIPVIKVISHGLYQITAARCLHRPPASFRKGPSNCWHWNEHEQSNGKQVYILLWIDSFLLFFLILMVGYNNNF